MHCVTVGGIPTRPYFEADVAGCLFRVSGPALWERMQNSFGYLATGGYNGHVFPVVIGETGSLYTSVRSPELRPCLAQGGHVTAAFLAGLTQKTRSALLCGSMPTLAM